MRDDLSSKMEKLQMCRICLVENVRMYVVVNRNLHVLYEKLTDIPFVTEDRRPILACFFCCTKLKQCCLLLRKCLEAEEQFAQMMNVDYESNFLINQDRLKFCSGFIKSPIEHISIVDICQTESISIKEELPAVCEALDDIIEPKEEHHSDELEPENLDNSCLDVADIPPQHSESDLEDDVPVMEFKTEMEEEEISKKKLTATEMISAPAAKKPKLDRQKKKNEKKSTSSKPKKNGQAHSKNTENTTKRTSKTISKTKKNITYNKSIRSSRIRNNKICKENILDTKIEENVQCNNVDKDEFKCKICNYNGINSSDMTRHSLRHNNVCAKDRPYKCDVCQKSFNQIVHLKTHIRTHTGEKPYKCDVCQKSFNQIVHLKTHILTHTGEKSYKCGVCQRSFNVLCSLKTHIRTHTGDKPYKCDTCQKSFSKIYTLKTHIRTHTGEKPYKCEICKRSFSELGNLKTHIRTHTGEKPYKCDVCLISFTQKSSLKCHLSSMNHIKQCGPRPEREFVNKLSPILDMG